MELEAQKFRLRAIECGLRAGIATEPRDQAKWHELERVWLDLANSVEADNKLLRRLTPTKLLLCGHAGASAFPWRAPAACRRRGDPQPR
jgi:hypothetical protein